MERTTTWRRVGAGVATVMGTLVGSVVVGPALPASAEVGTDTLREGESISSGSQDQFLRSRSGQHVLRWEANEGYDFVGQRFGSSYVFTFAVGEIDDVGDTSRLVLQTDGNLVAYGPAGEVLFASGTVTTEAVRLVLQDDGNLVLSTSDRVLWASGATPSAMDAYAYSEGSAVGPTSLLPGHHLLSPDRRYRLVMQGDGNLVLYGPDRRALWATATFGGADSVFVAQTDGNLVVYDGGRAVWASGTHRRLSAPFDSFTAALQSDGNFVQYYFSGESGTARAIWSSRRGRLG